MRILVLNSGSSSLKFLLADAIPPQGESWPACIRLAEGAVSGIGGRADLRVRMTGQERSFEGRRVGDHGEAVHWIFAALPEDCRESIEAVGHRIVHGGETYREPILIDDRVVAGLDELSALAPLHNPAGVAGIRAARKALGSSVRMVAVFDTAFHHSLPPVAAIYALPQALARRHRLRRYGFHGIAHASLARGYAICTGHPLNGRRLITLQLGNGCSVTAVRDGRSIDTSMGFTPLEGLVMGTRSGDLDPAIVPHLVAKEGVSADEVERWLNERSGLLGVSGLSRDMRRLLQAEREGHADAALAVELFCYRARKYIGAYLAVLEGADAVVFGGGIGEHQPEIRGRICRGLEWAGLQVDAQANAAAVGVAPGQGARISTEGSRLEAYVVGVDEEIAIAEETARLLMKP